MKTAIYIRISGAKDQKTDMQRAELQKLIDYKGWENVEWYEDKKTGKGIDRTDFQRLMRNVRAGQVERIVCWKLDRIFRNNLEFLKFMELLEDLGIEFLSKMENIDLATPAGRLMVQILGAFAEFESAQIGQRISAGMQTAIKKGRQMGPKVRRVHDLEIMKLRKTGMSMRAIARGLKVHYSEVQRAVKDATKR